MFGLAARWKRSRTDPLTELARAIEAISDDDRRLIAESTRVERLRERGAGELHEVCLSFVEAVNERLSRPTLVLDPAGYSGEDFTGGAPTLFQINLRGRLLQIEFRATEDLTSTEDFRRPYILTGALRTFNQDFLVRDTVNEKSLFYCLDGDGGVWHYFDPKTYGSGLLTREFLADEMTRLL